MKREIYLDALRDLLVKCKCGVYLEVNAHRDSYQDAERALEEIFKRKWANPDTLPEDVQAKMIELNTIVSVQFYPDSPVSFYRVWHYDVGMAIADALDVLESRTCPKCLGTGIMEGDATAPPGSIRRQNVPCPECQEI